MAKVRVVERKGLAAVVEWYDEELLRAVVPAEEVEGDYVNDMVLLAGVPIGIPWAEVIDRMGGLASPERIEAVLKAHGIWTVEDLQANPTKAAAALMSAYSLDVQALLAQAISHESEKEVESHE